MKTLSKTVQSAINYFKEELGTQYDVSELNQLIQITFLHYFKLSRTDLVLKKEGDFLADDFKKIIEVVKALKINKPLAQILGEWEFYGLSITVNEHTLIPRPETEELVQLIIEENKVKERLSVLDIGTGTGCIALALKNEMNFANVYAYDVSVEALNVAIENARRNGLEVTFNNVDILDWENQIIENKYDVIVSNPPYIIESEKDLMHKNVLNYEPHLALFVKDTAPLLFYNAIANFALKYLNEKGKLYFEINEKYGMEVKQLLMDKHFKNVNIVKDMNGKDRMVSCEIYNS